MNQVAREDVISPAKVLAVGIATALLTFLFFPVVIYDSIVFYGIPADLFIAAGYVAWLLWHRKNHTMANAFAAGFFAVVALCIVVIFAAKPSYGLMIIFPIGCVALVHWRIISRL